MAQDSALLDPPSTTGGRRREAKILIIGTGFSGLGMAARLKQTGEEDFLVIERRSDVGGTWHDNTYPGCACDVPSNLYSFSFALNPDWSESFSPQPEIRAYLEDVATPRGHPPPRPLRHHGHRGSLGRGPRPVGRRDGPGDVRGPHPRRRSRGAQRAGRPRRRPAWTGSRARCSTPPPGTTTTTSPTSAWPSSAPVRPRSKWCRRSSPSSAHLDLYQRTPPWIMPRTNRPLTRTERFVYRRVPSVQKLVRNAIYWARELMFLGFRGRSRVMQVAEVGARKHLTEQVRDPALRAKLEPDYAIGCKRILLSNDYYPALTQPNVELVRPASPRSARTRSSTSRATNDRSTRSCSAPAST